MEKAKRINRTCLNCGSSLSGKSQGGKHKYCPQSCVNKDKLRKKKPGAKSKLWQHEPELFERAMEMYWSGLGGAQIARRTGIPAGTIYSWIHDFGNQKERTEPPMLPAVNHPAIKSPKEQFRTAETAAEWLGVLRDNALPIEDAFENMTIRLVCGVLRGQSASTLCGVISESLREDPLSGQSYAFCNKGRNTITVIAWKAPVFELSKYVKAHGTFIWPTENLGATIEITRAELRRMLFIRKSERRAENLDIMRFSCYN